jgi:hypothetical protein
LEDLDASDVEADERLERRSQYGQLQHVFALRIKPRSKKINPSKRTRILLLALILEAKVTHEDEDEYKVTWYERNLGSGEVVDVKTIQCAIGRIKEGRWYWVVDRSVANKFTYLEYV